MRLSYEFGTTTIAFDVQFRNRKTLGIEVEPPGQITVTAPTGATEEQILEIVKSRSAWIVGKLFEIREIQHQKGEKQYVNGEAFLYLGRNHSLQIEVDDALKKATTKMERGKLVVYSPSKDEVIIQKAIEKWYRDRAKERINDRIKYFSPLFDVEPTRVQIKDQQKRWGSCTPKGELLFNWKCVMAPANVLDYIVVHEMCHLVHRNHSKAYWQLLKRVMPDYEIRKQWLKQHGIKYDL